MAEYGTEIGKFSFEGNNLMPEVIIKGRIRQEKHESTERFYGIRYIGKEALEQRNYQNFEHMLSYFHNFLIPMRKSDPDAEKQNNRQPSGAHSFKTKSESYEELVVFPRRNSILSGMKPLPIFVDGERWTAEEANQMLNMKDVDYIELLTPQKAMTMVADAIDGALVIRTKKWEKEIINSKGVHYTPPLGIANLDFERPTKRIYKTPETPGKYRIFIDIINERKSIQSYVISIEVK